LTHISTAVPAKAKEFAGGKGESLINPFADGSFEKFNLECLPNSRLKADFDELQEFDM
jgi:hypothetical protein